jgi:hypothetical protein
MYKQFSGFAEYFNGVSLDMLLDYKFGQLSITRLVFFLGIWIGCYLNFFANTPSVNLCFELY